MSTTWTQSLEWEVPPSCLPCGNEDVFRVGQRVPRRSYGPVGLSVGVAVVSPWEASPGVCPLVSMRVNCSTITKQATRVGGAHDGQTEPRGHCGRLRGTPLGRREAVGKTKQLPESCCATPAAIHFNGP